MSYQHAKQEPIADAEVLHMDAAEEDDVQDPRLMQLYLDSDGRYRWYEEDAASEVASDSLLGAFEEAEAAWDGFQLVELRGEAVGPDLEINDTYAADELAEIAGDEEEV
jgi:hypothetical protein